MGCIKFFVAFTNKLACCRPIPIREIPRLHRPNTHQHHQQRGERDSPLHHRSLWSGLVYRILLITIFQSQIIEQMADPAMIR